MSFLEGVDVVVHLAASVPRLNVKNTDPDAEYYKSNVEATINLARQAVAAGVKRFLFVSTIKVNGESTAPGRSFFAEDIPNPQDPYAVSKWQAEQELTQVAGDTDLEVVIIRPPLVYGPGVKGNFQSLLRWVNTGLPLPLGDVNNRRSLISLDNLVDFITVCIDHPAAANQTFLVSDGEDLSTTDLLKRLGQTLGKPTHLIPVPSRWLEWGMSALNKKSVAQRLCGNLQVNMSATKATLCWEPPVSVDEGLRRTVQGLGTEKSGRRVGSNVMIRLFDVVLSLLGLVVGLPLILLLVVVGLFDTGSPVFMQERVGRRQQPFNLLKFRTMKLETASVATHLASAGSITKFGSFLRKTKLDELLQLWNVLAGEMSLVGPRPCLYSQEELIRERAVRGVYEARPGITGLAQVNEIDMSTPRLLAETDQKMLANFSLRSYFRYIAITLSGKGFGDRVKK